MNKYQKALNNIAIVLAETDFILEHKEDFETLKELVDTYDKATKVVVNQHGNNCTCIDNVGTINMRMGK